MNRRDFLVGALALPTLPTAASAAATCSPSYCEVGIPNINVTKAQECPQWCWAASISAIFALHNHYVDQKAIVAKMFGPTLPCVPATNPVMFNAINGPWVDSQGRQFWAQGMLLHDAYLGTVPHSNLIILNELAAGRPLLSGAVGHATVVTAMRYLSTPMGPIPLSVTVRDPWPGNPNRRDLSPQEVMGTAFLASVIVT